jgi:peptidoglycan-associated lipoprotein
MKASTVFAIGLGFGLLGCAHKQNTKLPPDTAAGGPYAGGTKRTPRHVSASCKSNADCTAGKACVNQICVDALCTAVHVHFDFDSSEIPAKDRAPLERAASCLRASQATKVTIEGNADERGTEEYNVALGDRRAQSVAKYLEMLGASQDQVKTVSYGEENPVCTEHDESCWAKNRRALVGAPKTK